MSKRIPRWGRSSHLTAFYQCLMGFLFFFSCWFDTQTFGLVAKGKKVRNRETCFLTVGGSADCCTPCSPSEGFGVNYRSVQGHSTIWLQLVVVVRHIHWRFLSKALPPSVFIIQLRADQMCFHLLNRHQQDKSGTGIQGAPVTYMILPHQLEAPIWVDPLQQIRSLQLLYLFFF